MKQTIVVDGVTVEISDYVATICGGSDMPLSDKNLFRDRVRRDVLDVVNRATKRKTPLSDYPVVYGTDLR